MFFKGTVWNLMRRRFDHVCVPMYEVMRDCVVHSSAPIVLRQNKAYWSFGRFFFDLAMIIG